MLLTLSAVFLALFPVDTPRAGVWYTRVIRGKRRVFISVFGQQDLSQLAILRQKVVSGQNGMFVKVLNLMAIVEWSLKGG